MTTGQDQWGPCTRGGRCARVVVTVASGRVSRRGQPCPRSLCDADRDLLARTIRQLGELYRPLQRELINLHTRTTSPRVSGTPERGVPLRLDVDALLREVPQRLVDLVNRVHHAQNHNGPDWYVDPLVTMSVQVSTLADRLADRIDGLIALDHDGVLALGLFDLYYRARSALGFNDDSRVSMPGFCAVCDLRGTLVRWESDPDLWEGITCTNCGHTHTRDDYAQQADRLAARTTEEHA